MTKNKKIIFCIIGKSGAGKDTIIQQVLKELPWLQRIVPYTTRRRRDDEENAIDYYFVGDATFKQHIVEGYFMEHTSYQVYKESDSTEKVTTYYGYPIPDAPVSLEIYPYPIYKKISQNPNLIFIPIYITTDDESERIYRLIMRETKNEEPNFHEVARRIAFEMTYVPLEAELLEEFKDNTIINDNYYLAGKDVVEFIKKKINEVYENGVQQKLDEGRDDSGTSEG